MPTLYNMTSEWQSIQAELEANGGEITAEIEERINSIQASLPEKLDRYYELITDNESVIDAIDKEVVRLGDKKKALTNSNDSIKAVLRDALITLGYEFGAKNKIAGASGIHHAYLSETPGKVVLSELFEADLSKLPFQYCVMKKVYSADKKAISDDFKAGVALPEGITVVKEVKVTIK